MKPGAAVKLAPEAAGLLKKAAESWPEPLFLVGGALRDACLGRPTHDLDLASASAKPLAKRLAQALGGTFVELDEGNGVYRVALGPRWKTVRQVDIAALQGAGIEEDLRRRDFTINAMALPLSGGGLIDPRGGLADLSRRRLRCESEDLFKDDPLRILRAFRIAAQLGFSIEDKTLAMMTRLRHRVRQPAGERVQAELLALLSVPGCSAWLKAMDEAQVLTALFEDLEPARQCALSYYGPGGVLTHSLETAARADFLLHGLRAAFPKQARAIAEHLKERSGAGAPWSALLILAALLHDVSKAETAKRVGGRLRFFGHDAAGARRAAGILKALKFSREHIESVSAVIAHHLRPGNLASSGELTDKAVYRFFRDLGREAVSLLLVCWADHASYLPEARVRRLLATALRPPGEGALSRLTPEARKTVFHLQVIAELLRRLFDADKKPVPERLLDGREVMKVLGLSPGPQVGEWLERLREAQAEGKVSTREQALDFLRRPQ